MDRTDKRERQKEQQKKIKAKFLTALFMIMFLAILYFITLYHPEAWKVYGIVFGIIGVIQFTRVLNHWILS